MIDKMQHRRCGNIPVHDPDTARCRVKEYYQQLAFFDTGKACSNCGLFKSFDEFRKRSTAVDGFRGSCKECQRLVEQAWRDNNRELVNVNARRSRKNNLDKRRRAGREYQRDLRTKNPEILNERTRRWKSENKESVKEYNRRYHLENAELIRGRARDYYYDNWEACQAKAQQWRENHPGYFNEKAKKWLQDNRERAYHNNRQRRYREKGAEGTFTHEQWLELCELADYKCLRCGRGDVGLTRDHITPLSLGGTNQITNIQPLCASCNSWKGVRVIDYRGCFGP